MFVIENRDPFHIGFSYFPSSSTASLLSLAPSPERAGAGFRGLHLWSPPSPWLLCDNTRISTRVMGTHGNCAPEYAKTRQALPVFEDRKNFSQMGSNA
ncbi:hypothetical protein ZIOFF_050381 [Zingiber officinale]|uniref:Uncharacterized protein n=1 Tax=Zingiber officinale TaxID=94328 RepID=A0A8J5KTL8_ZINOF|nr:hypothetical protein ZIOFF_050381 [Zingiber officinale]